MKGFRLHHGTARGLYRVFALAALGVALVACSSSTPTASSSTGTTSAPASSSVATSTTASSSAASTADDSSTAAVSSAAPSSADSSSVDVGGSSTAAAAPTVKTTTGALGTYLVNGDGRTLYMFTPDTAGASTCYDNCADAWPPLLGTATAGAGADGSLLSTVARTDGTTQVVYGKYPLYYFDKDTAAGDTKGQGVGTKWYVVGADGEEITTAAAG